MLNVVVLADGRPAALNSSAVPVSVWTKKPSKPCATGVLIPPSAQMEKPRRRNPSRGAIPVVLNSYAGLLVSQKPSEARKRLMVEWVERQLESAEGPDNFSVGFVSN